MFCNIYSASALYPYSYEHVSVLFQWQPIWLVSERPVFDYCKEADVLCALSYCWCTRWFKYDRDYLCVNKSQFVPVIFEPPCSYTAWILKLLPVTSLTTHNSTTHKNNTLHHSEICSICSSGAQLKSLVRGLWLWMCGYNRMMRNENRRQER